MDRVVFDAMRTAPLADSHWKVLKKKEEYENELQRFRAAQSERVALVNKKQNEAAKRLHERIFVALRWAHPRPANTYCDLVLEYCVHLTGPTPEANFPKQHQLNTWRQRLKGGTLDKLLLQIDHLCLQLRNTVLSRNEQITVTNQVTAQTVEKLRLERDVKLSWIKNAMIGVRDKFRTIWYYASNNQLEGLKRYFSATDRKEDVNDPDPDYGFTALHYACMKGHFDVAVFLMENGADVLVPASGDGRTPLHLAAAYSGKELVLEILARGGDENILDHFGCTPLMLARQNKNKPAVKVLENWSKLLTDNDATAGGIEDLGDDTAGTAVTASTATPQDYGTTSNFVIDASVMLKMSPTLRFLSERLQGTPAVNIEAVFDLLQKRINCPPNVTEVDKLLVNIRMCDRHAYMCIDEGFLPQALQSFRRRWCTVFSYLMEAETIETQSNSVHSVLSAPSNSTNNPISIRFAVEVAMDAVEFCIRYGYYLEAESTLSECLLLKDFRFRTLSSYDENFALFEEEWSLPGRNRLSVVYGEPSNTSASTQGTDSTLPSERVKDSDDIGSLKRRLALRHCEILLYLHDMVSQTSLLASNKPPPRECAVESMIEWLRRRSEYEALLSEVLAAADHSMSGVLNSSRVPSISLKAMSGTDAPPDSLRDLKSPDALAIASLSEQNASVEGNRSVAKPLASDGVENDYKLGNESFDVPPSQSAVRFRDTVSSGDDRMAMPSFVDMDRSVWSYAKIDNPEEVRDTYKEVLLQVCVSNALETIRVFFAGDEYNAFIIEPLSLAPALEILSEALDRQGKPELAREHASHASVVYERSLGPMSVDCIRCIVETVRLRLRSFMGGMWGHQRGGIDSALSSSNRTMSKMQSRSATLSAPRAHGVQSRGKSLHAPPLDEDLIMPSTFINNTLTSTRTQAFLRSHPDERFGIGSARGPATGAGIADIVQVDAESSRILTELFQREHSLDYYRYRFEEAESINRAAADLIDRVSQLSSSDPVASEPLMIKSINIVAMAELLLSEARLRLKTKQMDDRSKQWVPKVKTHVSIALSNIISQRRHGSAANIAPPSNPSQEPSTAGARVPAPGTSPLAKSARPGSSASTSASSIAARKPELKVPKFPKQSLPHPFNPQMGTEASMWASQFASASIVSADAAAVMCGEESILDRLVEPVVNVPLDKRSSSRLRKLK